MKRKRQSTLVLHHPVLLAEKGAALQVAEVLGSNLAEGIRILYGGSVKGENAHDLLSLEDVDGALVGGASLTPTHFLPILAGAPD